MSRHTALPAYLYDAGQDQTLPTDPEREVAGVAAGPGVFGRRHSAGIVPAVLADTVDDVAAILAIIPHGLAVKRVLWNSRQELRHKSVQRLGEFSACESIPFQSQGDLGVLQSRHI
jgi:hypothetical protein